jgi:hypothetical protein
MIKSAILVPTNFNELTTNHTDIIEWCHKYLPLSNWDEIIEVIEFLIYRKICVYIIANSVIKKRLTVALYVKGIELEYLMIDNSTLESCATPIDLIEQIAGIFMMKKNEIILIKKRDIKKMNVSKNENVCYLGSNEFVFDTAIDFKKSIFELLLRED